MASELERATDMFTSMAQAVIAGHRPFHQTPQQHIQQSQAHQLQQQQAINNNLLVSSNAMNLAPDMLHSGPPVPQQQQTSNPLLQQQQQPLNLDRRNWDPRARRGTKVLKKPQHSSSAASASTPSPAAAATPVANAPTPAVASSSPAMKSPKGKAPGKPKASIDPTKRRPSKAVTVPPQTSAELVQSSPWAPTSNRSTKRPHDDNTSNGAGPATGSSSTVLNEPPNRPKTEWESAPSEALRKKIEAIDSIKTEEDASEGQESLHPDISDTSELILKGYGPIPDISGAMPSGEFTPLLPTPPSPIMMYSSFVCLTSLVLNSH